MAQYTRTTVVDSAPAGDTVKEAVLDLDTDLTGIVAAYNAHDPATTAVHGVGAGTVCGTTLTQTLTNKTVSSPTLTGTVAASGATISNPTITAGTIQGASTLNALTFAAATTGWTGAGGTASKTLTVSDTMTLALGAANLKWFMNAAGTAPEWASGISIKQFTYDCNTAAGNVAYTGIGFQPVAIIMLYMLDGTYNWGVGYIVSALGQGSVTLAGATQECLNSNSKIIYAQQSSSLITYGDLNALNADGFQIGWTKTGSPTQTLNCHAICFR